MECPQEKLLCIRWFMKLRNLYYCLSIPVNQRTQLQKSAVVRLWRRRDFIVPGPEESLILLMERKEWKHPIYLELFVKHSNKLSRRDIKSWNTELPDSSYTGLTERQVTADKTRYLEQHQVSYSQQQSVTVRAKHVHLSKQQIDLIDLTKQPASSLLVLLFAIFFLRWTCLVVICGSHHWKRSQVDALQEISKRHLKNMDHQIICIVARGNLLYGRLENLCKKYNIKRHSK